MHVTTPISFGTFNGPSYSAIGTGGLGFVEFQPQSSAPSTPATNTFRIFANSAGKFTWIGANGFQRVFDGTANTADRTYTLPDASGTVTVLGNASTGSGSVVLQGTPTLTTPVLGVASGTSLALGGATIGTDALGVTGTSTFGGNVAYPSTAGWLVGSDNTNGIAAGRLALVLGKNTSISFSSLSASISGSSTDTFLTRAAAATLQHGAADAAAPVAQTVKFQDVVAGTSNTAGVNATIQGSAGTGSGAGGSLILQVAPAGSTGTAKNAWVNALTIAQNRVATFASDVNAGNLFPSGSVFLTPGTRLNWNSDLDLNRIGAANLRLGFANNATPVANTLTIGESSRPTTDTNVAGANGTIQSGNGTGTGAVSSLLLQSPVAVASGSGAQTQTTGLTIKNGVAILTSYAVAGLPAAVQGGTAFVTDSTVGISAGLGLAVIGGGSSKVPVYSDGSAWLIG